MTDRRWWKRPAPAMEETKDAGSNAVAQDQPFPAGPQPGKAVSSPSGSYPVPSHLLPPPAAESRGKGRENDMCYYCKEKGHWAEDCPSEMMKRRKITMPLKTTRSRRLPAAARGLQLSSPVPARVAAVAASDETARAEKGVVEPDQCGGMEMLNSASVESADNELHKVIAAAAAGADKSTTFGDFLDAVKFLLNISDQSSSSADNLDIIEIARRKGLQFPFLDSDDDDDDLNDDDDWW